MENRYSRYIILDGINRCGKETQMFMLAKYIYAKSKQYDHVLLLREPTYGRYGKLARNILINESDPLVGAIQCLDLFVKDRVNLPGCFDPIQVVKDRVDNTLSNVIPARQKGYTILQDRGKYSTVAFQGAQGISVDDIVLKHKNDIFLKNSKPDLVLILDITPEESVKRRKLSGEKAEKFEKLEFLEDVRKHFLNVDKYFSDDNIKMINGMQSIKAVFTDIKNLVDPILLF